jgi:hypothetical protein
MSRVALITGKSDVATEHKSVICGPMWGRRLRSAGGMQASPIWASAIRRRSSETFDVAYPEHAFNPQDDLLFPIAPDA